MFGGGRAALFHTWAFGVFLVGVVVVLVNPQVTESVDVEAKFIVPFAAVVYEVSPGLTFFFGERTVRPAAAFETLSSGETFVT